MVKGFKPKTKICWTESEEDHYAKLIELEFSNDTVVTRSLILDDED